MRAEEALVVVFASLRPGQTLNLAHQVWFVSWKVRSLACFRRTERLKIVSGANVWYRKIPKIRPGAYIFQRPFLRGLYSEGLGLIVGSKLNVFALFYFVFEGNFPRTSPRGAYIWRGDLTKGFLRYQFGGLIFGGAYFRNFTVCMIMS